MSCTSAEELQARLAIRALWSPAKAACKCPCGNTFLDDSAFCRKCGKPRPEAPSTPSGDDSVPATSTLHRHLRAEIDEVLKSGLSRRLRRIENSVNTLIESGGNGNGDAGQENIEPHATINGSALHGATVSVTEAGMQTNSSGSQDYWVDQGNWGDEHPVTKLESTFQKAYNVAVRATWPRPVKKKYGPSRRQTTLEEPPVKEEKLEREMATIRSTTQCVTQNLGNRDRQIANLKSQIAATQEFVQEEEDKLSELDEILRLANDPSKLPAVHESRRRKQKQALERVEQELKDAKADAEHHRGLTKQQHAFFMQAETIYCQERGAERMQRSPAGEVFLVPQPLPMPEEKAGADSSDIGVSIANPYECDSWPFEPNVLARRCPKECPMDNVAEETLEDLLEAQRPGRTNPFRGGLNLRNTTEDDDEEEDEDGPAATARSL